MAEVNMEDLRPNSHKYKADQERKEKLKSVVNKGNIVSTKRPFGKKLLDSFLTEDGDDIKTWLIVDVIIPGIKNTVLDMLQMAFFGETRSRGSSKYNDYTSYSSRYRSSRYSNRDRDNRHNEGRYESDDRFDYNNIILRNRDEAERVVEELRKRIRDYKCASIADLFDLLDLSSRYTDNNYGWTDERDIGIRRVSSGYLIDVAEVRYLN